VIGFDGPSPAIGRMTFLRTRQTHIREKAGKVGLISWGQRIRKRENNATILGGKLQTSGSNAVIETVDGSTNNVLSGGTIASGSKIRCFRSAFGAQN